MSVLSTHLRASGVSFSDIALHDAKRAIATAAASCKSLFSPSYPSILIILSPRVRKSKTFHLKKSFCMNDIIWWTLFLQINPIFIPDRKSKRHWPAASACRTTICRWLWREFACVRRCADRPSRTAPLHALLGGWLFRAETAKLIRVSCNFYLHVFSGDILQRK